MQIAADLEKIKMQQKFEYDMQLKQLGNSSYTAKRISYRR
jgi:hypothetical protein